MLYDWLGSERRLSSHSRMFGNLILVTEGDPTMLSRLASSLLPSGLDFGRTPHSPVERVLVAAADAVGRSTARKEWSDRRKTRSPAWPWCSIIAILVVEAWLWSVPCFTVAKYRSVPVNRCHLELASWKPSAFPPTSPASWWTHRTLHACRTVRSIPGPGSPFGSNGPSSY